MQSRAAVLLPKAPSPEGGWGLSCPSLSRAQGVLFPPSPSTLTSLEHLPNWKVDTPIPPGLEVASRFQTVQLSFLSSPSPGNLTWGGPDVYSQKQFLS